MKRGNIIKERVKYYKDLLTTRDGLIMFLVTGAVWSGIIVNYTDQVMAFLLQVLDFIKISWLRTYISYVAFNLVSIVAWTIITVIVVKTTDFIFDGKTK